MIRYIFLFFIPLFFIVACDTPPKNTKPSLSEKKDSDKTTEKKEKPNDASYINNILKKAQKSEDDSHPHPHSHSHPKKKKEAEIPPPMDSDTNPPPGSKKSLEAKPPQ